MRYRKRIKIARGLNINLSKRGVSATLGPRGANVNVGRSGAYLNTGLPGTGLYNRRKIADLKRDGVGGGSVVNDGAELELRINLNGEYKPVVELRDNAGNRVTSETVIKRVKRTSHYKESLQNVYTQYYNSINGQTAAFTDLHKGVLKPVLKSEMSERIASLSPKQYCKKSFAVAKPTPRTIEKRLKKEAESKYSSILFWKNKKSRSEFVDDNLERELEVAVKQWEKNKEEFEQSELMKELQANREYRRRYEEERKRLEGSLDGEEHWVVDNFETLLAEVDIAPEFFVDFEYDQQRKRFFVDLDLPEIDDLPTEKATLLQSGRLSVKQKSNKEQREDYAKCVAGLGFLVAGIAFASSVAICCVEVAAYTQRVDRSDGHVKDEYIYLVEFDREGFSKINYPKIDPVLAFQNFNHKMDLTKTSIFRTIEVG